MDVRDLIVGLMASFGRDKYSVKTLCALTAPFHVQENAVRTALSRLKAKNWLDSGIRNNRAYYFFSKKGSFKRTTVARSFTNIDWTGWDETFWGFLYSVREEERELRYRIRKKLEVFHFSSLYPGFWIRPKHPDDHFISDLSHIPHSHLIVFTSQRPFTGEQIDSLWGLKELHDLYEEDISFLNKEIKKNHTPVEAFITKMETGNRIVGHLFKDPLVPPRFLPTGWQGPELRRTFFIFDKAMTENSKPFWEKIVH